MIWKICCFKGDDMCVITFTLVYLHILYINYLSKFEGLLKHNNYIYKFAKKKNSQSKKTKNPNKTTQRSNKQTKINATSKEICTHTNKHKHEQTAHRKQTKQHLTSSSTYKRNNKTTKIKANNLPN
jgi:hypothetical protein